MPKNEREIRNDQQNSRSEMIDVDMDLLRKRLKKAALVSF